MGGHFARKGIAVVVPEYGAGDAAPTAALGPITPIPTGSPAEGILVSALPAKDKKSLAERLAAKYLPVDLDTPGLRLHHLEPPVFTLPGFFTAEQCGRMVAAAEASGEMVASRVGAGNAGSAAGTAVNDRRTSTSVLINADVAGRHEALQASMADLHANAHQLLLAEGGKAWGRPGKLPNHKQLCFEALQVAKYEAGQFFRSHEDGFPIETARLNGFQRRATVLVYLNDVAEGGATRFDRLGFAVRPTQGTALLFFPGLRDGASDPRTLHAAEDAAAGHVKWVTQQWVASGLDAVQEKKEAESAVEMALRKGKAGGKKGGAAPAKKSGFGAK